MEWYKGLACVTYKELTDGNPKSERIEERPVMSRSTYDNLQKRGRLSVVRRACYETPALISFKSLPLKYRQAFIAKHGDPEKVAKTSCLKDLVVIDAKAEAFFSSWQTPNGDHLKPEQISTRTMNVSILNALNEIMTDRLTMRKALGNLRSPAEAWKDMARSVKELNNDERFRHSLPKSYRRLRDRLEGYKTNGYQDFIHANEGNSNASKLKEEEQYAMLQELASDGRNLDNEMVASLYNTVAKKLGWETISAGTVANWKLRNQDVQYVGRHGLVSHRNNKAMQVKRRAPRFPLYYWTVDGWDVELLYQQREEREKDGKKYSLVTYSNRPTVVVLLDPCTKYPVGYAIGTHETPELIREAFRNAFKHVKKLFGKYYRPWQLQTDNYGKKTLTSFYEACTDKYTPARVKNAKAKVVEPYFKKINSKYCHLMPNWSGYGITSKKENQPNDEWLNQNRHKFPVWNGVVEQVEGIIKVLRSESIDKYMKAWEKMSVDDRLEMSDEEFLVLFGETTGFGNNLEGGGIGPTILGEKIWYDSFDPSFRDWGHLNWIVKYDPENLDVAVAIENLGTSTRPKEGTRRFTLERKYIQPMALKEREPGDVEALQRICDYNDGRENTIKEKRAKSGQVVRELFEERLELNDTLAKLVLCDSRGQHKDERNRLAGRAREKQLEEAVEYEEIFDERDLLKRF